MSQPHVHPSRGPSSAIIGAERFSAIRPEPSSRASTSLSTSVSDIASELSHSSPSMGAYANNIFHAQDASRLPERERPTSQLPNATFPTYASGAAGSPSLVARTSSAVQTPPLVSSAQVSPSPPPIPPRVTGPVTPAPAHRSSLRAHSRSQSQTHSHLQSHHVGVGLQAPPSSARSKVSVAETPSGDLANFHLLNGSPLQSVADLNTPTPSPRTPSMPSVSPADAQAYALAIANGDGYFPPLAADHRRFLPGSSVSPSVSRAQRAAVGHRSSFYCRICQADPCHDITATACGHVFCNACIVEEVRENARCPVCNAAVLLFAMLKLDLS